MFAFEAHTNMASPLQRSLLIVRAGDQRKLPYLSLFKEAVNQVFTLEPQSSAIKSSWSSPYITDRILYDDSNRSNAAPGDDRSNALAAVKSWSERTNVRLDGVLSYTDNGNKIAPHLAKQLSLTHSDPSSIGSLTDKYLFRQRLLESGVPSVRFRLLRNKQDVDAVVQDTSWRFPVVLKPRQASGKICIKKLTNSKQLEECFETMQQALRFQLSKRGMGLASPGDFVLEEYFEGHEVDIDGWARNSQVEFCQIADNNPPVEPHFLETGGTYPTQLPDDARTALTSLTQSVLSAFPSVHSCFHFEARIRKQRKGDGSFGYVCVPIELNCRVGGAECPASFKAITGYDLAKVSASIALGLPVPPPCSKPQHRVVRSINLHSSTEALDLDMALNSFDPSDRKLVSMNIFNPQTRHFLTDCNDANSVPLGWISCGGNSIEEAQLNLMETVRDVTMSKL